ncbi:MAG: M48 family metalloprotease [Salibacteraceae bacterium]
MRLKHLLPIIGIFMLSGLSSCYKAIPKSKDIDLGALTSNQIHANPKQYPLLNKSQNPEAYKQLKRVVNNILESPDIKEKEIFAYDSIAIIQDDKMVNAFCTPGGYIFVYTGLIKLAKNEDQLASVIGHEIAHAELRHSVKKLSRGVGRQAIIIAAAAAAGASFGVFVAVEIGNKILGLGLGRDQESHADKKSVIYMGTGSHYSSVALADFFEELIRSGNNVRIPPILSSHPDTENRIYRIRKWARKMGYRTEYGKNPEFATLQNSLPK